MLLKNVFFFFLFIGISLVGAEDFSSVYTKHLLQHLSALPHWCSRAVFLKGEQGKGAADFVGATGETYRVETVYDASGRVSQAQLINATKNFVEGTVVAEWKGALLSSVRVEDEGGNTVLSYYFSYDKEQAIATTILEGNLTGKGNKERYETKCSFDEKGDVTREWSTNGKVVQYVKPRSEGDFFVVITSGGGTCFRDAMRSSGGRIEEIVDDGASQDINNLEGVTRRKFSTTLWGQKCDVVTVGAWDLAKNMPVVLRRSEIPHNLSQQNIQVFDANHTLVSIQKTYDGSTDLRPDFSNNEQQTLDDLGRLCGIKNFSSGVFSAITRKYDVFGNMVGEEKSSQNPKSILYTAHGQPYCITFPDGSTERFVYSLDGNLEEHINRDGTGEKYRKDPFGRVLEESNGTTTTYYTYAGLECTGVENSLHKYTYVRDLFGRVTKVECSDGTATLVSYDALNRIIGVRALSQDSWTFAASISLDGLEECTRVKYDREADPYVMKVIRLSNGTVIFRSDQHGEERFSYRFDDVQRLISVEHELNGKEELVLRKIYCPTSHEETTIYADQTSLVECVEREKRSRIWKDSEGHELLREDFAALDAKGSKRVTQTAGSRERIIEWEFGKGGRLSCIKVGEREVSYLYDKNGRLIAKKTPLHTIHYTWDGTLLKQLSSEDGSINYEFTYDPQGRMTGLLDRVTSKQVVRSFDQEGRLDSDGEVGRISFLTFGKDGRISEIRLPDGSTISYEKSGKCICVRRGNWSAEKEEKDSSNSSCSTTPLNVVQKDGLGEWKEEYSYDALNQLSGEKGEFNETYSFSPLGMIASKDGIAAVYNEQGEPITFGEAHFTYDQEGNIKVQEINGQKKEFYYDALGRVSKVSWEGSEEHYRYDALSRLQEIRLFQEGVCKGSKELVWIGECEIGSMENDLLAELKIPDLELKNALGIEVNGKIYDADCDERGSIVALSDNGSLFQDFRYSAFGALHAYDARGEVTEALTPWLYCGKRLLSLSDLYDFGHRRYDPFSMRWCEKDPLGMVDGYDDRVFARNNPAFFLDVEGLFAFPISWSSLKNKLSQAFHKAVESVWKSITFTKKQLNWFSEMQEGFEEIAFHVVGEKWTQLIGYNPDMSMEAVCGKDEKNPKVRLTFINGVLNWSCETARSAALVSKLHGDTAVHYVYAATQGFTYDIVVRGGMALSGIVSRQAELLATLWKRLINEMGGVEGGGIIFHYAHSLGASDTYNALLLLTQEERKLIRVNTFGGSTIIGEGLCGKSDNYVSTKDGIPILDFSNYMKGSFGKLSNVHFLPSDSSFLLDHMFQGKTYRTILEVLGQQFQEEYLLSEEE